MTRELTPASVPDPGPPLDGLGLLFEAGRRVRLRPGAILISEGDASDRVMLVLSGRLKVSSFSASGRETVLGFRGPGAVLGELSALDGEPHAATVEAVEPTEIAVLAADRFVRALTEHPDTLLDLLRSVIVRLRDADRKRAEFGELSADGRVAERLLELAAAVEPPGDGRSPVTLTITQAEIAGWVGCSREAVNRAMHRLSARGLVSARRGRITVLDPEELRRRVAR
jgi:CRP/FNR family cyclic AMP-dependent transcriptional regulator